MTFPVLPTRDAVLLPGAVTELQVGRPCSVAAMRSAMERDGRVLVLLQKDAAVDAPGPDDLHRVGCVGELIGATRASPEAAAVSIVGLERVRVESLSSALLAEVSPLGWSPSWPPVSAEDAALVREFLESGLRPQLSAEANARVRCATTAEQLVAIAALYLDAAPMQQMLETQDLTPMGQLLVPVRGPSVFSRLRAWLGW